MVHEAHGQQFQGIAHRNDHDSLGNWERRTIRRLATIRPVARGKRPGANLILSAVQITTF